MEKAFYENINKATYDSPHMDFGKENFTYLSHFHNEIEIAYLVEGQSSVFCDNKKIDGQKGDVFIFMPGQIHSFLSTGQNKFWIFKLRCENEIDGTNFSTLRTANIPIKRNEALYSKLLKYFEDCRSEYEGKKPGQAYFLNSLANNMVGEILRCGELTEIDMKADKKIKMNAEFLTKVNTYIEKNFGEKIVIADIAKHCGLSEYYFAHTFKSITGSTFFDYLTVFRLEKAIDMHINANKPLIETAFACGFTNVRSFYRLFKKHYLISPKEYINKIKK